MKDRKPNAEADLRSRAEKRLTAQAPLSGAPSSANELPRLVHELQVHQIELEMQNDELVNSRAQMEALKDRYYEFYDFSPTGFLSLDAQGSIIQVNLNGARLLGRERSQLSGQAFAPFVAGVDRTAYSEFLQLVFATRDRQTCEVALERRGQPPLHVQIEGIQSSAGRECRAVLLDITGLRRAEDERVKLQGQLLQAQKTESLGHLAGGIAHDFNNMLGVIIGHVEMALDSAGISPTVHDDLLEIRKAAERAAELTSQLLAFARLQPVAPRVLDLNVTIAGMHTMLRRLITETIDIDWRPGDGLWMVKMDSGQAHQLLTNLCINARDAIADVGRITVRTQNVSLGARDPGVLDTHGTAGDFVLLTVTDTGRGMEPDIRARIFEPFFTTKEQGKGTGLGLATVSGIVSQNQGFITVESVPGQGSTFKVYLPRCTDHGVPLPAFSTVDHTLPDARTVLLVEDQIDLLDVTRSMLERLGCRVLTAATPGEAIGLAERHGREVNLLLTDVIMPGMNGRDLAKRLLAEHPHLRILFMSGYTADLIGSRGLLDDRIHFLQKPFLMKNLADKLWEALGDAQV